MYLQHTYNCCNRNGNNFFFCLVNSNIYGYTPVTLINDNKYSKPAKMAGAVRKPQVNTQGLHDCRIE